MERKQRGVFDFSECPDGYFRVNDQFVFPKFGENMTCNATKFDNYAHCHVDALIAMTRAALWDVQLHQLTSRNQRGGGRGQAQQGGEQSSGNAQPGRERGARGDGADGGGREEFQHRGGRGGGEFQHRGGRGGGEYQQRGGRGGGEFQQRGGGRGGEFQSRGGRGGGEFQSRGGRGGEFQHRGGRGGGGEHQHRGGGGGQQQYRGRGGGGQQYREGGDQYRRGTATRGRGQPWRSEDSPSTSRSSGGQYGGSHSEKYPPRDQGPSYSKPVELPPLPPGDPSINVISKIAEGGKLGRPIKLKANHFELRLGKVVTVFHYDVDITPDRPKKMLKEVMRLFRAQYYHDYNPAFDGVKNIFSAKELPFGETAEGTILVEESNARPKEFKVKIQKVNIIDLTPIKNYCTSKTTEEVPMIARQALDIVFRHSLSLRNIVVGSSFFSPPRGNIIQLGNGMEMYRGSFQSVVMGWKPFLNIDVANKAFPSAINVIDLIKELDYQFNPNQPLQYRTRMQLAAHLKGLRVCYDLPNNPSAKRNYRVNDIDDSALDITFKKSDDSPAITVDEYYRTEKKHKLNYPNMPCLWVGSMQSDIKVRIPCELCTVLPGQVVNKKLGPYQTSAMIKNCATNTQVRQDNISEAVRNARYNDDPTVKEFDLFIDDKFTELIGRVLAPPDLKYANGVKKISKGVWEAFTFLEPKPLERWTILNLDRYVPESKLNDFEKQVVSIGTKLGMNVQKARPFKTISLRYNRQEEDLAQYFNEQKRNNLELVFVVISNQDKLQYSYVKQAAELLSGCLTQCIKSTTMLKKCTDISTVTNILLKVNAKLAGINHIFNRRPELMEEHTMIMGADVTHPSPDNRDVPSVAAVTASHDPQAFSYNLTWRLQPPGREMIADMEAITKEHLDYFAKQTEALPKNIIFYRDGVSDGQFREVLQYELAAIRRACGKMNKEYQPKITFIVVQKRHHTRLFLLDKRESQDKNGNVPAGTCVDTVITQRDRQNFYLVSHASIQGVARPTKYAVLWDDHDFTADQLEGLTYYLCHMFARCTRSVSYPAPTYYAHLAAARAKVYSDTRRLNMNNLPNEQLRITIKECIVKELPMFFI